MQLILVWNLNSYCLGSCRMSIGHAWMCHPRDKVLYLMLERSIQCNWMYLKLSLNVSDIFNYWPLSIFKFIFEWLNWPKALWYSLGQPSIRLNLICMNGPPRRFNCLWRFWIALGKLELPIAAFKLPWKLLNRKWTLLNRQRLFKLYIERIGIVLHAL